MMRESMFLANAAVIGGWPAWVITNRLLSDRLEDRLRELPPALRGLVTAALADLDSAAESVRGTAERQIGDDPAWSQPSSWITPQEAAMRYGLTDRRWRTVAALDQVTAKRDRGRWLLDETDVRDYRARTGAE